AGPPGSRKGGEGLTVGGVGTENLPFGILRFSKANAGGLLWEPPAATATPPKAPACPPNSLPNAARERSSVKGGEEKLLVPPAPMPLIWRIPWYDVKKSNLSFLTGPPSVKPNWFCLSAPLG